MGFPQNLLAKRTSKFAAEARDNIKLVRTAIRYDANHFNFTEVTLHK